MWSAKCKGPCQHVVEPVPSTSHVSFLLLLARLKRGEQPLAAFAVQGADRAAQPVHRLDQFGLIADRAGKLRLGSP